MTMGLADQELLSRLVARDGPLRERGLDHLASGSCRYADLYADRGRPCPWCAAVLRRRAAIARPS